MLIDVEPVPVALFASLIKGDLYRSYKEIYGRFPPTGTAPYIMALHVWHGAKTNADARSRLREKLQEWMQEIDYIQGMVLPDLDNFREDKRTQNTVYIACVQAVIGYLDTLDAGT